MASVGDTYRYSWRARAVRILLTTLAAITVGIVAVLFGLPPLIAAMVGGAAGGGSLVVSANVQERRAARKGAATGNNAPAITKPSRTTAYAGYSPISQWGCLIFLIILAYFLWRHC